LNYLDLFHGIGGFALGAHWAGMKFENHYCSDIEPYAQELYKKRFPDSIQLGDITKINTADLPQGDWIISGGFPCQDISIAGKGAGIHGKRSGLWFEYWRIINDLRPRFAIMENVGMLIHRGLREVLGSLAEIGYNAEWQDIRASDMGAPHKRERIWIVAYAERREDDGREFGNMANQEKRRGCINSAINTCGEDVAYPTSESAAGLSSGTGKKHAMSGIGCQMADPSIPRLQGQESTQSRPGESGLPAECGDEFPDAASKRLEKQGFQQGHDARKHEIHYRGKQSAGEWWATEPAICGMADGLPAELYGYEGRLSSKSHQRVDRLKGLGNAIVPQIAELLFKRIKYLLESEPRTASQS
jgi:DNA (cytosine-5)-methyltransferase 1